MPRKALPFVVAVALAAVISLVAEALGWSDPVRYLVAALCGVYLCLWGLWYAFLSGPNRAGPRPGESQRS